MIFECLKGSLLCGSCCTQDLVNKLGDAAYCRLHMCTTLKRFTIYRNICLALDLRTAGHSCDMHGICCRISIRGSCAVNCEAAQHENLFMNLNYMMLSSAVDRTPKVATSGSCGNIATRNTHCCTPAQTRHCRNVYEMLRSDLIAILDNQPSFHCQPRLFCVVQNGDRFFRNSDRISHKIICNDAQT